MESDSDQNSLDDSGEAPSPTQTFFRRIAGMDAERVQQSVEWEKVQSFGDSVPQVLSISDKQVLDSAGGYVFKISSAMRVRRFLILGTTGGTYYAQEKEFKLENMKDILEMLKEGKGMEVLKEIYDVNKTNRAPKMTPLIFCLALVIRHSTDKFVLYRAYQMLTRICRIPTHLFEFLSACKSVVENKKISWGRRTRRNISRWYLSKEAMALAMAVTKYQQRAGWSHRDVIRLSHPNAKSFGRSQITLTQLQISEKQSQLADTTKDMAIDKYNDIFLYCVKGLQAVCARYPALTVVDPPVVRPLEPVKPPKEIESTESEGAKVTKKFRWIKKKKGSKSIGDKKDNKKEHEAKTDDGEKSGEVADENQEQLKENEKPDGEKESKPPKQKPIRMRFTDEVPNHLRFLQAVEDLKQCYDDTKAVELIKRFGLVREHVPTRLLSSVNVWKAMLQEMPMTAMIRNLAKMSSVGLLPVENNAESEIVCRKLRDVLALKAARVHPLAILMAQAVYKAGRGDKGKLTWKPNSSVLDALNDAFYAAFVNVEPTGKRFLLALDVSGSMTCGMSGSCLSCREASAALAMLTLRTEPVCEVVGFMDKLAPLPLTKTDTINEAVEKVSNLSFGGTDCALPMLWAAQHKKAFDCFVVYTDSETYFGDVHPSKAMQLYRQKSGIHNAKLIVVGMVANNFTIADPDDANMMDIVGFDASAPQLMRDFVTSGFEEPSAPAHADDEAWSKALGD